MYVFDVSTAFLSGNPTTREVYAKAPEGGLPATEKSPAIPAYALLRILKSAYGLAEAPRLWYLRACQLLEESGMSELSFARATFVCAQDGRARALCTLHVDDGLLAGDASCPVFQGILKGIDSRFNIKEWKKVGVEAVDFLGCQLLYRDGLLTDCMRNYVKKIEPMRVTRAEGPLQGADKTSYRRLVMQLRWPATHVFPERLFMVSELAQQVEVADMSHARKLNALLTEFQTAAEGGSMQLQYRSLGCEEYEVISFFDASLGKTAARQAQQGQVHFLTVKQAHSMPSPANILSFRSSKIARVVKSSLAAEGNALSSAADDQLYLRLLCEALTVGPPEVKSTWKEDLKVAGTVVTDAKALYDHLLKTGHVTAEKQTMLDILAAKQLVESASMGIAWVPTFRQFADSLTKDMSDELFGKFRKEGLLSLRETADDRLVEERRAALRRGQRERRKARMKESVKPTSFSSDVDRTRIGRLA